MLQSPDFNSPPSRFADWLELNALARGANGVGLGDVKKVFRIMGADGPRHEYDQDAGEVRENEIFDPGEAANLTAIADEIAARCARLGDSYPFEIIEEGAGATRSFTLKPKATATTDYCGLIYIFCLLVSGIRLGLLNTDEVSGIKFPNGRKVFSEHRYGYLFQICSSIALGGYLLGEVVSFGYPRKNKSRFLAALTDAWGRFGAYEVVRVVPQGAPLAAKDGGIDLIGWIHFGDRSAAKMLVLGQVASGLNWNVKSVSDYAKRLKRWFVHTVYEHFQPAMFIPFDITDADNFVQQGPGDLRSAILAQDEAMHGIIFDRERIVFGVGRYLKNWLQIDGTVDRVGDICEVRDWNDMVMPLLQAA